ncbi:DNA glycosylase [Xylaria bambusicola]|uniref:DNA glycosylase n=1 Tax=Xylaria bambusicola TaxID=326684 RepID=UPI00200851F8|nr:DNA glycosylase [Xylaria bambusicola]KAI0515145.1 DNA glycosylase [Xylaria bambusicola]
MAKAASDNTVRRRSARHATAQEIPATDVDEIKTESAGLGDDEKRNPAKAGAGAAKRRMATNSLLAEPRRSKRVKSVKEVPEQNGEVKFKDGSEVENAGRKRIKLEDEDSLPISSPPLLAPVKEEVDDDSDKGDYNRDASDGKKTKAKGKSKAKTTTTTTTSTSTAEAAADLLQSKKLKSYSQFAAVSQSPYPDFPHPTASEAKLAHSILSRLHGARERPAGAIVAPKSRSGCGDSSSVLDALVRTILSQNTSNKNSSRAKLSMDAVYGSSASWSAIVAGGQEKLAKTIESGGLAVVKSKVIISILSQVYQKYGTYSLDHLFSASDDDAMREMLSFKGVGPKTASCVLLFCLRRENFAVDTHVYRITGLLGWRPGAATRDQTHAHLDARIPDEDKYGLHVLLIKHGKECAECKAGGKNLGKCELRKAFRKLKKNKGEEDGLVGDDDDDVVKEEEGEEGQGEKIEEDLKDDVKV